MKSKRKILIAVFAVSVVILLLNKCSIDINDVAGKWYNNEGVCLNLTEDKLWFCNDIHNSSYGIWKITGRKVILNDIMDQDYTVTFQKDEFGEYLIFRDALYRRKQ